MAIDLTGVINENEFYTHHYLSAILENDLKGFSATDLSKKLGVSQPSVSIWVKRGEKIAKAGQLKIVAG